MIITEVNLEQSPVATSFEYGNEHFDFKNDREYHDWTPFHRL
jgi:hypothetical protein